MRCFECGGGPICGMLVSPCSDEGWHRSVSHLCSTVGAVRSATTFVEFGSACGTRHTVMVPYTPIILGIPTANNPFSLFSLGPTSFEQISCDCLFGTAVPELTYLAVIAIVVSGNGFYQFLLQFFLTQRKISFLPHVPCGRPSYISVLLLCHSRSSSNGTQ